MSEGTIEKVKVGGLKRSYWIPLQGCPGCQHPTIHRVIGEVLEEMNLDGECIVSIGIGCAAAIATLNLDAILGSHGGAPDMATAIKRLRPDKLVLTVQGDGDCVAIGAGPLLGAIGRAENITILMLNNTNYGTTGGQIAPTTLLGQKTVTSPNGRNPATEGYPIHTAEFVASFDGVAYSARGALNTMPNYHRTKKYIRKAFETQMENRGLSFVEVLSACPPNWGLSPVECIDHITKALIPEFPVGEFRTMSKSEEAAAKH
jgi:2-oxoglutarate ferredoxin oxidoreductase subunit beta